MEVEELDRITKAYFKQVAESDKNLEKLMEGLPRPAPSQVKEEQTKIEVEKKEEEILNEALLNFKSKASKLCQEQSRVVESFLNNYPSLYLSKQEELKACLRQVLTLIDDLKV